MKTSATAKFIGTSARKTGLVAALIRGRKATDAKVVLTHADQRASVPVGKVLDSAIANAENNYNAKAKDLVIESVWIGPGPSLKRSRARGKGSAAPILKRSSHITIVLTDGKAEVAAKMPVAKVEAPIAEDLKAEPIVAETKAKTAKSTDKKEAK